MLGQTKALATWGDVCSLALRMMVQAGQSLLWRNRIPNNGPWANIA